VRVRHEMVLSGGQKGFMGALAGMLRRGVVDFGSAYTGYLHLGMMGETEGGGGGGGGAGGVSPVTGSSSKHAKKGQGQGVTGLSTISESETGQSAALVPFSSSSPPPGAASSSLPSAIGAAFRGGGSPGRSSRSPGRGGDGSAGSGISPSKMYPMEDVGLFQKRVVQVRLGTSSAHPALLWWCLCLALFSFFNSLCSP
jgi:hypothetical protein